MDRRMMTALVLACLLVGCLPAHATQGGTYDPTYPAARNRPGESVRSAYVRRAREARIWLQRQAYRPYPHPQGARQLEELAKPIAK